MRVTVTGGAGFVGSSLALAVKARHPSWCVVAFDNLHRRGSELTLARLGTGGVSFIHGDVRLADDVATIGACDVLIDCSAEPSVLAGVDGSPAYLLNTNLGGTLMCLEHARKVGAGVLFLSTSRVYPIAPLLGLPLTVGATRFELGAKLPVGVTVEGVTEDFPLHGARSLYGATKLASELIITEYVASFGMRALINRCGVLAGPWQMGKVDQGVMTHWVLSHELGRPLKYIGHDGKQVRDVLHIDDLSELVDRQLATLNSAKGEIYNVGGGVAVSFSLRELTAACVAVTGKSVSLEVVNEARANDVPWYCTNSSRVKRAYDWAPTRSVENVVEDVARWVRTHRDALAAALS